VEDEAKIEIKRPVQNDQGQHETQTKHLMVAVFTVLLQYYNYIDISKIF